MTNKKLFPKNVPLFAGKEVKKIETVKNVELNLSWRTSKGLSKKRKEIIQNIWKGFPISNRDKITKVFLEIKEYRHERCHFYRWHIRFGW